MRNGRAGDRRVFIFHLFHITNVIGLLGLRCQVDGCTYTFIRCMALHSWRSVGIELALLQWIAPDTLSGLKVRVSGIFSDFRPQLFFLTIGQNAVAYRL